MIFASVYLHLVASLHEVSCVLDTLSMIFASIYLHLLASLHPQLVVHVLHVGPLLVLDDVCTLLPTVLKCSLLEPGGVARVCKEKQGGHISGGEKGSKVSLTQSLQVIQLIEDTSL